MTARAALVIALALAAPAAADPDLRVHHAPLRHLHMRPRAAQVQPSAAPSPDDESGIPAPLRARTQRAADLGIAPNDATAAVHSRLDLGFGVDGAQPSDQPNRAGHPLGESPDYAASRGYGFGDLVVGSHGLVLPSLSTYLAAHATYLQSEAQPPLPTVYDHASATQVRAAWAEVDGIFDEKWLQPLSLRAGRQYIYGPAPAHLDGFVLGYETKVLRLHLFGGTRVPEYDLTSTARDSITGADLRLDLFQALRFPAVIDASQFHWGDHDHTEVAFAVTRGKNLYLRGSVRTLDGRLAHELLSAHVRVSDVTRITAELDHRSSYDWRWDPELVSSTDASSAKRYLELGDVGPRAIASVRAGTVLLDNVDVLLRSAAALDQVRSTDPTDSSFAATWGEVGGALEVRVRRTLALGTSLLARGYRRASEDPILTGLPNPILGGPLPTSTAMGEQSFVEGGVSVRYSSGARKLSASAELYTRRIRWHRLYEIYQSGPMEIPDAVTTEPPRVDLRGGGRVSLEAWITPSFRLRAEYELSTALDLAPEVLSFKSLRILAEGSL